MNRNKSSLMFFSGFIFIVLSIPVLENGFKGIFVGSSRWIIGVGFIIIGLLNIWESEFWKPRTYKPLKETKGFWNKIKLFLKDY